MEPIITVIIPVYNNEQLIERCINSVLEQTHKKVEIIVINDGSNDKTGTILKKYDSNLKVKVLSVTNRGVSAARNVGILTSKGEYIYFLDSDDYILPLALEQLLDIVKTSGVSIVMGSMNNKLSMQEVGFQNTYKSVDFIQKVLMNEFSRTSCGILFKKDVICKEGVTFSENLSYGEDFIFTIKFLLAVECGVFINNKNYIVEELQDSASRSFNVNHYEQVKEMELILNDLGKNTEIKKMYISYLVLTESILAFEKVLKSYEEHKVKIMKFKEIRRYFRKDNKASCEVMRINKKNFLKYNLLMKFPYFLIIFIYSFLLKENFLYRDNKKKRIVYD